MEAERDRPVRGVIYSLIIAFVTVVVVSILGIFYTGMVANDNNRKWCRALIAIDDAYSESNVTTPAGKRIAEEFRMLRHEFEC